MEIVEFVGAPGVGKSTIVNQILASKKGGCKLWHQRMLPYMLYFPGFSSEILRRAFLSKPLHRFSNRIFTEFSYRCAPDFSLGGRAGISDAYIAYSELLLPLMEKNNFPESALAAQQRMTWFLYSYSQFGCALTNIRDGYALFDEGLAQRATSLAMQGVDGEGVKRYLHSTPLPDFLFHVVADDQVVKDRLVGREGENSRLLESASQAKNAVEMCVSAYEERGCQVYRLNSVDSVASNVTAVMSRLQAGR
ncbi:hypothetical protein [Halomonas mongoliensis]|uniref:hypothetical protein n=1 Tax=Halomonas mongoliensis TaxID=321265 RepID=UPI00403A8BE3